jgi:NAD(P)-dependent dehydrogenase (short-subunit alcohol dehydrogenase family)
MTESGHRALVVGASGELGRSVARELANRGFELVVHGHSNRRRLHDTADEVGAIDVVEGDLREERDVAALGARIDGPLHALAFCAGVNPTAASLANLDTADWDEIFAVNVRGAFLVLRELIPALRAASPGRAVLVSSVFGQAPHQQRVAYAASKAALNALVKGVAREEAPDVMVNGVAPSVMWTELARTIFARHAEEANTDVAAYIRQRQALNPHRRFVEPDECAILVARLLDPENTFVNGQTIAIDGAET